MALIRARLVSIESAPAEESPLVRAERVALQVRKIIESVAFAALSAVEHRNCQTLVQHRTKDADRLLAWLAAKQLLRLPSAQRLEPPPTSEYKFVLAGVAAENMDLPQLQAAYSRASAVGHERHPERLKPEMIIAEGAAIEQDARHLRSWLWLHLMFLREEAFLVQMDKYGSASFFVPMGRIADLPPGI